MDDATAQVIEEFGHRFEEFGMSYNLGRVYGLTFVSNSSITQEEISEVLGISQSVVSTTVRQLVRLGMLEKVRKPGGRSAAYQSPQKSVKAFVNRLQVRIVIMEDLFSKLSSLPLDEPTKTRVTRHHRFMRYMAKGITALLSAREWAQGQGED